MLGVPFDILTWAEATQNSGLAGCAAKGPTGYTFTGDTITLKDEPKPYIHRFGGCSDTKPSGMALIPTNSNGGKGYYGPAALHPIPNGILDLRKRPLELMQNDIITAQINNTNVNEGSLVFAEVTYGQKIPNWDLSMFSSAELYVELATITSGADVTYNSGAVSPYAACTNTTNWFDPKGEYYILGICGSVGIAAAAGILHVSNVGGKYKGYVPGIINNMLSGVTFSVEQPLTLALSPIGPISGDAMKNSVTIGATHTTAGALTFGLIIAKTR